MTFIVELKPGDDLDEKIKYVRRLAIDRGVVALLYKRPTGPVFLGNIEVLAEFDEHGERTSKPKGG